MSNAIFPETIAPAVAPAPLPMKKRATWKQTEVAALVSGYVQANAIVRGDYPERFTSDEAAAKLREVGVLPKVEKPALSADDQEVVNEAIHDMLYEQEPVRTLQIRYAIKQLQALLPKRAEKS